MMRAWSHLREQLEVSVANNPEESSHDGSGQAEEPRVALTSLARNDQLETEVATVRNGQPEFWNLMARR